MSSRTPQTVFAPNASSASFASAASPEARVPRRLMPRVGRTLGRLAIAVSLAPISADAWAQLDASPPAPQEGPKLDQPDPPVSPPPSPDAAPSAAPDASPSAAPDASPSAAPDASPSAAPDAAPDAAPSAAPSVAPDAAASSTAPATPVSLQAITLFSPDSAVRLAFVAELGAFAVASHTIQFGRAGTELDYRAQGGQDNLFPFARASAELHIGGHHQVILLTQPLTVETDVTLDEELRVFDVVFPAGTPLALKYGFDFVRASYLYDFLADPRQELAIGASLQLRDAVIDFASRDGALFAANRDLGPVPVLKARGRYTDDSGWFLGAEVDGIYAGVPVLNGAEFPFEGALLDASVRAGVPLTGFANTFVNVRFLGGGARGTERRATAEGDGYANNWLATLALTLGFELR